MIAQKFTSGAFAFTRARGLQPRNPEELVPLTAKHGLPEDLIPSYPGDRTAIGRAIQQTSSGLGREGFLLRPITRTSTEVVYGIVREIKDEEQARVDHDFKDTVSWTAKPDPAIVLGEHPIARRIAAAYQTLRGNVTADDWSHAITKYLEANDAARVRSDGRIYWVPPQRIPNVRKLAGFLTEIGIDLVLCELEPEIQHIARDVAASSLDDEIAQLEAEAAAFDGTQRPSTHTRRLEAYQRLRERALLYRDALGVGVDRAQQVLESLERQVSTLLDVRKNTVIPRATTAPKSDSLEFAGATFHLTRQDANESVFTTDAQSVQERVNTLARMGLADTWQPAGPCRVRISNGGPPGARVSITVRGDLTRAAPHLTSLGIHLTT